MENFFLNLPSCLHFSENLNVIPLPKTNFFSYKDLVFITNVFYFLKQVFFSKKKSNNMYLPFFISTLCSILITLRTYLSFQYFLGIGVIYNSTLPFQILIANVKSKDFRTTYSSDDRISCVVIKKRTMRQFLLPLLRASKRS